MERTTLLSHGHCYSTRLPWLLCTHAVQCGFAPMYDNESGYVMVTNGGHKAHRGSAESEFKRSCD